LNAAIENDRITLLASAGERVDGLDWQQLGARTLRGRYVGASGLSTADNCSPENEERAWRYYRTPPDDRFPKWIEIDRTAIAKFLIG
jgi:hypothetical protein